MVKVDIEYCGRCNFGNACKDLENFLKQNKPEAEVTCRVGRVGSFEVKVNDILIHSKLQTIAFPKYESVLENVKTAEKGLPLKKAEEQPIENCSLM